jgi:uncharacterized protein (UPF0333 family)
MVATMAAVTTMIMKRFERCPMKDGNIAKKPDRPMNMHLKSPRCSSKICSSKGQVLVEFAMVLPLLALIVLGVIEMSYLLYDQHIVIRLTREGSNLISRGANISEASTAMRSMVNPPVNLNGEESKLIFTVLTKGRTGANQDRVIVYQRYEVGGLEATSAMTTEGPLSPASFGPAPDYIALNPKNDKDLRVTNVPSNLTIDEGQFVYVTEIYSRHTIITPIRNFGVSLPSTLYSVAFF